LFCVATYPELRRLIRGRTMVKEREVFTTLPLHRLELHESRLSPELTSVP
jgi:hypothetical protein